MAAGWAPEGCLCCLPRSSPASSVIASQRRGPVQSRDCGGRELHRGRSSRHLCHHLQLPFLLPKTLPMPASCPGEGAPEPACCLQGCWCPKPFAHTGCSTSGSPQSRDCEARGLRSWLFPWPHLLGALDQAGPASQGQLNAARVCILGPQVTTVAGKDPCLGCCRAGLHLGKAAPGLYSPVAFHPVRITH